MQIQHLTAALISLASGLSLAACATTAPVPAADSAAPLLATQPVPPHTWIVTDGQAIVAALPALPDPLPIPPAAPADPAALAAWDEAASAWMSEGLRAIVADGSAPPRAARELMLLSVAMSDGLSVAAQARGAGLAVSDDALLAEAAARLLAYTHPLRGEVAGAAAAEAAWAGLWRGATTVSGVLNGRQIGAAVADQVIAWGAADGSLDAGATLAPPVGVGYWAPLGPSYDQPQLPSWSLVRTIAIGDPASLRASPPPAWDSPEMRATYEAFVLAQRNLSAAERELAQRWAGGAGTVTPPGIWIEIARDLIATNRLETAAAAQIYATLSVALHDSAVACWESKYTYWLTRPQQVLAVADPAWRPLLKTPPHPSYPSGHASFSGAAAGVLGRFFPDVAGQLDGWAEDAARSRVVGGIHWPIDSAAGLAQGRAVAERVLASLGR